jgi:hypothetical protein
MTETVRVRSERREMPIYFDRQEFIAERWHYNAGDHVTLIGPTQSGKTTLALQLLKATARGELPAIIIVIKPRDKTLDKWIKPLKFQVVRDWPPPNYWIQTHITKPKGWFLWPRHTFDAEVDDKRLAIIIKRALNDSYKRGHRIVFTDEIFGIVNELKLDRQVNAILSRGSGMGCGLWEASQRPYNMPQLGYSGAEHLFLARDPDDRDRERFGEIGGIDPKYVEAITLELPKYHWLYIRRTGEDPNSTDPAMCIVGP